MLTTSYKQMKRKECEFFGNKRINIKNCNISMQVGVAIILINKFAKLIEVLTETTLANNIFYLTGIMFIAISALCKGVAFFEIVLFVCAFINFFITKDPTMLSFIILMIATKQESRKSIFRIYQYINIAVLSACIIMYGLLRILGSDIALLSDIDGRLRYNFFFTHPNNFAAQFLFTVLVFLYLHPSIKFWNQNLILGCTAVFIYVFPNSQTVTVVTVFYIFIRYIIRYTKNLSRFAINLIPAIIAICVLYITYMYYIDNTTIIAGYIKGSLEARFVGAATAFDLYDITLFGTHMTDIGEVVFRDGKWVTFWFDLGYARILFDFGIIGTAIFLWYVVRGVRFYAKKRNYEVLAMFLIIALYAISEWTAFSITTAFPMLFLAIPLDRKFKTYKLKLY